MVRGLCFVIDENRFTMFTDEEIWHLVEYLCSIQIYMKLHVYMVFHDDLLCVFSMFIIV